jgi:hypothetical protein
MKDEGRRWRTNSILVVLLIMLAGCGDVAYEPSTAERAIVGMWVCEADQETFEFFAGGTYKWNDPASNITTQGTYRQLRRSGRLEDTQFVLSDRPDGIRFDYEGETFTKYIDGGFVIDKCSRTPQP